MGRQTCVTTSMSATKTLTFCSIYFVGLHRSSSEKGVPENTMAWETILFTTTSTPSDVIIIHSAIEHEQYLCNGREQTTHCRLTWLRIHYNDPLVFRQLSYFAFNCSLALDRRQWSFDNRLAGILRWLLVLISLDIVFNFIISLLKPAHELCFTTIKTWFGRFQGLSFLIVVNKCVLAPC